ncbi:MAG: hypothetical protein AB7O13_03965 [Alphaproteobacteria bacterium]
MLPIRFSAALRRGEVFAALRAGTHRGSCLPKPHTILHRASPGATLSM